MTPFSALRRRRFSLELKFVLTASAVIILGLLGLEVWFRGAFRSLVYAEAEQRAQRVAESTALAVENSLLYSHLELIEEEGLLDNFLESMVADSTSAVIQALVFDTQGRLLNANDYSLFSQPGIRELGRLSVSQTAISVSGLKVPWLYRITVPLRVSTLRLGTLVMTFSHEEEFGRVAVFQSRTIWAGLLIGVVGILFSMALARGLARPIKQTADAMAVVTPPDYDVELPLWWNDEIRDLQESFLRMLARLRAAHASEEKSQRALAQAEKLATTGTLVAGLAHEINNPLSGARNCLTRIVRNPADQEQIVKYSRLMDSALQRIEHTVGGLLNFTRRSDSVRETVDLRRVIAVARDLMRVRADKKGNRIVIPEGKRSVPVRACVQELEQVMVNLLINAVDASAEGATVQVHLSSTPDEALIEVEDEGPGVPPESLSRIFDPFFTTKGPGEGTGLGLWVVAGIIERHGGGIACENRAEGGACFRISLPLENAKEPEINREDPDCR